MRVVWVLLSAFLLAPAVLVAQSAKPIVKIVSVVDGASPGFDVAQQDLAEEIDSQLSDRYEVVMAPTLVGDWTRQSVRQKLDEAYADPSLTAVFGFGHNVVAEVASRRRLPKPTILPFVTSGTEQGLPRREDTSGRQNLAYITEELDITEEVERLREVAGSRTIVFLTEETESDKLPDVRDKRVEKVFAGPNVADLLNAIPNTADGVVLAPMRRLSADQRRRLADGLIRRQIASISVTPTWVDQGVMMTIRSVDNERRRAQRAALALDLILEGRPASGIHVDFEDSQELLINLATARAVGVRPTFELLLEADVIDQVPEEALNRVTMNVVMRESVDANLDLLISRKFVESGEQGVKIDRGPLLPEGVLDFGITQQDADRIQPGGLVTERQGTYTARATQRIYSEGAWTAFASRKLFQEAREYGYFVDVLDVMLLAGVAYVDVLRAQAQERIQRNNIQLTREYLELARLRLEVGVANASELYRWQVTLAENQSSVVDARAQVQQAKIELNRVLNRPSETPIQPNDLRREADGTVAPPEDPIGLYMADPYSFKLLRAFMVREGLRNSPEAREIRERTNAQVRIQEGRTRELWLPEFFIEGGVQHDFWRDGEGSEALDLGFELDDGTVVAFPGPDKFGWDVGIYLSIPLSRGGAKVAEMRQAAILVERLTAEFARVEQNIDVGVRTELYSAAAALASVTLTRRAAKAAADNLALVTDLYRRGTVDIITLTDAQTQSLISDLDAVNAVYDYAIALLFVNREAGHFRNLDTPEARESFADRLHEFVDAGESIPPAIISTP
ncbi:MAG: TolC family protein [Myxococcota bacterium]